MPSWLRLPCAGQWVSRPWGNAERSQGPLTHWPAKANMLAAARLVSTANLQCAHMTAWREGAHNPVQCRIAFTSNARERGCRQLNSALMPNDMGLGRKGTTWCCEISDVNFGLLAESLYHQGCAWQLHADRAACAGSSVCSATSRSSKEAGPPRHPAGAFACAVCHMP